MTQEEKELLLKELCARLPYGVMCQVADCKTPVELSRIDTKNGNGRKPYCFVFSFGPESVKPYLRPMSSMTKEEKEELVDFGLAYWDNGKHTDENGNTIIYGGKEIQLIPDIETYDWLNRHYFDYRGLIPKGLAIEVTEENNPYK